MTLIVQTVFEAMRAECRKEREESDDIIFSHLLRHSANQVRQLPRGKNNFRVICVYGMGSEVFTIQIGRAHV